MASSRSSSSSRQASAPKTARVAFNVVAGTEIGETVCVSGDHPLLGAWNERDALELVTTPEYYPTWYSLEPVNLPLHHPIKYKYFIKTGGRFDRWEGAEGDRTFTAIGRDMVITDDVVPSRAGGGGSAGDTGSPRPSLDSSASYSSVGGGGGAGSAAAAAADTRSSLSSLSTSRGKSGDGPAGDAATAAAASIAAPRNSSGAPSTSAPISGPAGTDASDRRADTLGPVDALLEGSSSRSLPPSPPQRPSQMTPPFSPGSPHSHHTRDHIHSGSESDFEDLVLDGRDAVIIVSVFLPIRIKLIQTDASNAKTRTTPRADGASSDVQHDRLRSLSQSSSNGNMSAAAFSSSSSAPAKPKSGRSVSHAHSSFHIEWDETALLSRESLFSSAQSHNLDVSDTRRIIYVGLIRKVEVVSFSRAVDAAGTAAAASSTTTTTTVDPSRLSVDLQDDLARVLSTDYACFPIFLQGDTRVSFYDNYCHKALWPTVHNNVDLTKGEHTTRFFNGLQHNEQYSAYRTVNSKIAKAVVEQYSDGDLIWVHDFHLALVPSFVLRKVQHATIGMFWHSPFPSSEIFRTLSVREDILRGILNCDQVGIHSYEYCRHFLTCCRRVLGLKYRVCKGGYWTVEYMGRDVRVTVAHACIDSALVAQRIASASCKSAVRKVLGLIHPDQYMKSANGSTAQIQGEVRKVIGGIDRLESMCGISEKMRGYEMFLAQNPSWVGRVVLVQIGLSVPERGNDYENTRIEVAKLAARINRRYTGSADGGANPVVIYSEMLQAGYDDRLALWRCADIMCVSAKREGFNLLPFEYICSRPRVGAMRSLFEEDEEMGDGSSGDDAAGERDSASSKRPSAEGDTPLGSDPDTPGILLLSEFTSCCRVLSGALKFNPYHIGAISDAFFNALKLDEEERRARFESLYEWVRTNPASLWAERVLLDLKHSRKNTRIFSYEGMGIGPRYRIMTTRSGFTRLDNETVLEAFQKAQRRLILLDIGGTLVHQVKVDSLDMFSKSNTAATKVTSIREDHTPPVAPGRPPRAVMTALRALAADTRRNAVYLVSGQDRATVASHFETIPRLGIVTDSGYSFRNAGEDMWETMDEHFDLSWVETVTEIMKIYMLRTVGTYMERKKFAVLWRFADADPDYGALQASELVDHLGNVMKNYDVLVIKGKGYVEVRPNGVDKGSVARRILNRHNSNTTAPLDFVLVLGDDVADEAMFGMVQNIMEQDPQPKYEGFLDNTGGASSKIKDVGVVSGISPHDPSQYAYVDDYRRQYRSFRKGNAKGAKGETSQVFSQPVGVGQRVGQRPRPPVGPAGRGGELVRAAGAAGPAKAAADVFTVTIGRKPSEASYYYDTPDDVVELLASMAKASVMWGQESKQQRSMSLSDLSQYAYRHASLGGDVGRAASGLGVEFASKALGIFHDRALSLDGPGSSPASSAKDGLPEFGIGISGGAGGNGGGGDPGVLVSGGQHSSGVIDPSGTLGSVVDGSGSSRRTREQAREEEREQLRADTQKTRLAGSNSLLNIAKLAAEGSLTDASSVEALVQPPIAPIPTMEDFLDFGAEDEDEANFF